MTLKSASITSHLQHVHGLGVAVQSHRQAKTGDGQVQVPRGEQANQ